MVQSSSKPWFRVRYICVMNSAAILWFKCWVMLRSSTCMWCFQVHGVSIWCFQAAIAEALSAGALVQTAFRQHTAHRYWDRPGAAIVSCNGGELPTNSSVLC
jgi:hypothetical protein